MKIESVYGLGNLDDEQLQVYSQLKKDVDIPEDPKARYNVFKEYIGKWHFLDCKYSYLQYALREDDTLAIKGEIHELNKIRQHPLLKDEDTLYPLYTKALHYMVTFGNEPEREAQYDELEFTLMMYLLHEQKYFETFYLPDEAFVLDDFKNKIVRLGEVYGTYFAYYQYLQDKLEAKQKLNSSMTLPTQTILPKGKKMKQQKILTFQDLFERDHRSKFDKIIEKLKKPFPAIVTRDYEELRCLDETPFVFQSTTNYKLNSNIPKRLSYLAGMFKVCKNNNWLEYKPMRVNREALMTTFNTDDFSDTPLKNAVYDSLDNKYIKPFEILFQDI